MLSVIGDMGTTTVICITLLQLAFAPYFGGVAGKTLTDSKLFYVENPYARDKIGLSLCDESKGTRNSIQSPIDIDLQIIKKGQFKADLNFTGLDAIPQSMIIRNTGYDCK